MLKNVDIWDVRVIFKHSTFTKYLCIYLIKQKTTITRSISYSFIFSFIDTNVRSNIKIENEDFKSVITISDGARKDTGMYKLVIENENGTDEVEGI